MRYLITAVIAFLVTIGTVYSIYNYVPLDSLQHVGEQRLGSTITTIQGTDTLSSSRSVINTNFSNLNTDKFELSAWYATTSAPQITSLLNLVSVGTVTTGTWSASTIGVTKGGTGLTALEANRIPFGNGTSAFATSSNLYWDNSNSYLGISSSTPKRSLSVGGPIVSSECNLTDGATVTFNLASCNQGKVVLGGNRTIDFTNETQALGQTVRFVVCQDGTGTRTLTWDAAVRWAGGVAPTLTTAINKCDVIAGFTTVATGTPVILLDKILNF